MKGNLPFPWKPVECHILKMRKGSSQDSLSLLAAASSFITLAYHPPTHTHAPPSTNSRFCFPVAVGASEQSKWSIECLCATFPHQIEEFMGRKHPSWFPLSISQDPAGKPGATQVSSMMTDSWPIYNSASWWWTGKPGVLQCRKSQRVGHNWATELNWAGQVCGQRC